MSNSCRHRSAHIAACDDCTRHEETSHFDFFKNSKPSNHTPAHTHGLSHNFCTRVICHYWEMAFQTCTHRSAHIASCDDCTGNKETNHVSIMTDDTGAKVVAEAMCVCRCVVWRFRIFKKSKWLVSSCPVQSSQAAMCAERCLQELDFKIKNCFQDIK